MTDPAIASCSDLGNARVLKHLHGGHIRFVPKFGLWYVWSGKQWKPDYNTHANMHKLCDDVINFWHGQGTVGRDWGHKCESLSRQNALLSMASKDPELCADPEDFDVNEWQLNTTSGVVSLLDGELLPHNPAYMHSQITGYGVAPEGTKAPVFKDFLRSISCDRGDLAASLCRFLGYCITGSTREQVFALWIGEGRNGKSTLASLLLHLLGDYAGDMATSIITASAYDKPMFLLDALRGKRFVKVSEQDGRRGIDREMVKKLTGGEDIMVERKYADPCMMSPKFKMVWTVNHKPAVEFDKAFQRRVFPFPFDLSLTDEEEKHGLLDQLLQESEGILRFLVTQSIEWSKHGLAMVPAQTAMLKEYMDEYDSFGEFLTAECILDSDKVVQSSALWKGYNEWARRNQAPGLNRSLFATAMRQKGYVSETLGKRNLRYYRGIAFVHDPVLDQGILD